MADNRYDRITFRGHRFDRYTKFNIEAAERVLGFALWIVQGGYNAGGVSASAGTHDGGGAVDISVRGMSASRIAHVVKTLRKQGFAAWHRPYNWDGRKGGAHIHAILVGNEKASSGAKAQVRAYRLFRNGLANNARDLSWHPLIIRSAPYRVVKIRAMTFNIPGEDKIPNGAKRIAAAMRLVKGSAAPYFVGWNELEGIKKAHVASDFAHDLDEALGLGWLLVKPTRLLNENYVSYQSKILRVVHQYDDSILESKSGGRHLTRVVFEERSSGLIFAVGLLHLVNGSSAQAQADRHLQSADALTSMKAVVAKHDDCPFIILGDFNMDEAPKAFVSAGLKNARVKADVSSTRNATTFTNYSKDAPSTSSEAVLDQIWMSPDFWVTGYTVRQDLLRGKFRKPRPSDHQPVVASATTT